MAYKNPAGALAYQKRYREEHKPQILAQQKEYRMAQRAGPDGEQVRERARAAVRAWYKKNSVAVLAQKRDERLRDPDGFHAKQQEMRAKNAAQYNKTSRAWCVRLRAEMLAAYGNACACCGETRHAFLALDHVNRDGKAHRLSLGKSGGHAGRTPSVYSDLKRRGWPKDGYRILCHNCNFATRYGNPCPHTTEHVEKMLTEVFCS